MQRRPHGLTKSAVRPDAKGVSIWLHPLKNPFQCERCTAHKVGNCLVLTELGELAVHMDLQHGIPAAIPGRHSRRSDHASTGVGLYGMSRLCLTLAHKQLLQNNERHAAHGAYWQDWLKSAATAAAAAYACMHFLHGRKGALARGAPARPCLQILLPSGFQLDPALVW